MFGSVVSWSEQIKGGKVRGLAVTKNTPADIIDKLNREINAGLADPKLKAQFENLGAEMFPGSPAGFGKFIADYTEKWAKVIRAAGVKAE
jgi:tripartite-type tricarboxylate transporter receptor subunit TctC